ncbi:neurogenic locus notch homolog protein 1-like [Mytilus californianus]|uniref:neurogenic locus notch homolog protein 1-like n=1 Tax=Mytilus californianus TaxID=6549 RepID=UPI002246C596|nr:neurogenic locus notch homolog protein 1-like [Mytilus californianus]
MEDINDLCDNHTCENGGSCYQYDASYYCHCISPFVGEHCDMEDINDLCDNHPCENGGSCFQYDSSYYCHCISPFVGEHCDMELSLNDEGRLLIHQPTGTYSVCLLDWDDNDASVACRFLNKPGKGVAYMLPHLEDFKRQSYLLNCEGHEDSIDLCQGQSGDHIDIRCENQGDAALECIEEEMLADYLGCYKDDTNQDVTDLCLNNPCGNGGTCHQYDGAYYCDCVSPFVGEHCDMEDMTDLCDNHPCENGGSCFQYDSSYYCHCISPFVGEHCDMELSLNDEGRLLIHQPTGTYSVCLLDWDDNDASVACRFLNKPGKGVAYMLPHSEDFKRQSYLLNCEGHEDSIDLCQGQSGDHIDIRCENQGDAALECIEEEMLAEYLGCYKDDTNRILDNLHIHELMNLEMCQGICEGYTYFGLQFHFECYCGNSLGDPDVYEKRPEEECTITCAGNERQICGGEWRISVYQGHSEYVTDLCLNNPCGNGGTCHQYDGAYYCDCFSPFVGGHCEIRLDLSDDGRLLIHQPTGTYSLCLLDWDDSDASVACRFLNKPGKGVAYKLPHSVDFYRLSYSLLCEGDEKSINQCSGESGEHIDMACQAEDDAALKCIEECNPDTEVRCNSLGPGKCISKDWICDGWEDCETGWDEFECEDVNDLCLNNPCGNDGTCHQYDGSSYCECVSPYVGGHCEMRLDLSDDGRLLIHQPTGTYSLCLLDWDDKDASVACRFLNKPGKGVAHKLSHSIDFYRLSYSLLCEGDEKSINQCSGESGEHIDMACQAEDDAALKCIEECNPDTEVRCNSPGPGKCISKDWVCDGWEDCETGWDEFECACNMDYHARCDASDDGMCLNKTWICDGISDCQSGWDEDNCGCDFNTHVRCNDNNHGKCILKEWICDGLQDCATAWDETYCDSDTNQCSPDAFDCGDGKCIVKDRRCDEIADCANMKDEMDCPCDLKTHSRCDDDDNGKCISNSYICDRTVDCITGWDEEKCDCKNNPFKFQCNDGTCLSIAKRCDVYIDCGMDAEDEQDCPCSSPTHFQCLTGTCIPANRLCDRIRDCPDEEDELFCDRPIKEECKPGYAACGEDRCILEEFMCDGYYDCLTHTDEAKERCYPEKGWPKPDQGQGPGGSNEVDKVNSGPTNDGSSDRDHEPGSSANKWSIDDLSSYFNEAPLSTNTSFVCLLMCLLLAIISTKP